MKSNVKRKQNTIFMYLTGKKFFNLISEIGEGIQKKILYNTVLRNKKLHKVRNSMTVLGQLGLAVRPSYSIKH